MKPAFASHRERRWTTAQLLADAPESYMDLFSAGSLEQERDPEPKHVVLRYRPFERLLARFLVKRGMHALYFA